MAGSHSIYCCVWLHTKITNDLQIVTATTVYYGNIQNKQHTLLLQASLVRLMHLLQLCHVHSKVIVIIIIDNL